MVNSLKQITGYQSAQIELDLYPEVVLIKNKILCQEETEPDPWDKVP
jgi:hypothetical protein